MSSKESNPKMTTKSFRLTASESSRLEEQMRAEDFTNLSKYIRYKVFGDRIVARKPKDLSVDSVKAMLDSVRERIAGIGADYNRIASQLVHSMEDPGQRNLSQENKMFAQLNKLAKEIKDSMNALIDLLHRIECKVNEGYSPLKTYKNKPGKQ